MLISPFWMRAISTRFPLLCPSYRLVYNFVATATLIPLLLFKHSLAGDPIVGWIGPLEVVRLGFLALAIWLFWAGAKSYDLRWFSGLTQLRSRCTFVGDASAAELRTDGILARVRHPWYGGALLLLWTHVGMFDAANLVTSLVLTVYVVVGAFLEERKLTRIHGAAYLAYQRQVPMFFPGMHGRRRQ